MMETESGRVSGAKGGIPLEKPPLPRLLIVDDDPGTRGVMLVYLKHLGYAADTVSNGKEAVDAVQNGRYGLVLLDCVMPELTGLETVRAVRAMDLPAGQPGIIAFTAQRGEKTRKACLAAGMDVFLGKPFTESDLREAVGRALELRWKPARRRGAAAGPPSTGKRVILVDDDASVRRFIFDVLAGGGYEVVQLASGEDARWLLDGESRPYDLLISDVVMPGMGGPSFAKWVGEKHPATRVLFITGHDVETARSFGLPEGNVAILHKPFPPDALLKKVAEVLGG
jgi:CheY-like chemotaxis protein